MSEEYHDLPPWLQMLFWAAGLFCITAAFRGYLIAAIVTISWLVIGPIFAVALVWLACRE